MALPALLLRTYPFVTLRLDALLDVERHFLVHAAVRCNERAILCNDFSDKSHNFSNLLGGTCEMKQISNVSYISLVKVNLPLLMSSFWDMMWPLLSRT